jgi:hypothetical protein
MTLVQILLPMFDNAGQRFDRELYDAVGQELVDRFGGMTAYTRSPATGQWAQDGDEVVHDDIVVYEVMAEDLDRAWWGNYRRQLEMRFGQEALVIRGIGVEML